MIEIHPFEVFAPPQARYLILGSFVAVKHDGDDAYDWYYGSKRNTFWSIIEEVYKVALPNTKAKQSLFTRLSIAITDIIYQCDRKGSSSLDVSLTVKTYNTLAVAKLLEENPIEKIFFTSRFVEAHYRRHFTVLIEAHPEIELVALPSPSPRYAAMSKDEKIKRYRQLLPTNI